MTEITSNNRLESVQPGEGWAGSTRALLEPLLTGILTPLGTSVAVFDTGGDLVASVSQSSYCRLLADAPRRPPARSQLGPYHEFCWTAAASAAIEARLARDSGPCPGGLLRHAVPILSDSAVVGAVVIAFGDPPSDRDSLRRAADYYGVELTGLHQARAEYRPPASVVVENAKRNLTTVTALIAALWHQGRESEGHLAEAEEQMAALESANRELCSAQAAVRSSRDYLRSILDSFPHPGLVVDSELCVVDANTAFLSHVGHTHDQVIGRHCQSLRSSHAAPLCGSPDTPCPVEQAWTTGQAATSLHTYLDDDGNQRNISIEASPLRDRGGRMTAVIEIFRDVTAGRRLTDTIRAINRLGQQLVLTRDEAEIARAVVTAARQMLRFEVCALLLEQDGHLKVVASEGYASSVYDFTLPVSGEKGITAAVARSGTAIYLPDVRQDPRYVVGAGYQALSELCVPLKAGDHTVGVLNVESDRRDAFDEESQQNLTILADVAAVALDSARAYRAEQQRAAEMTALFQLGAALLTERDPAAIAQRIILELGELLDAESAVVGVVNQESDDLTIYGLDSGSPIAPTSLALDGDSLTAHVVRTGSALRIDDLNTADLLVPHVQAVEPLRSWLGVPLRTRERVIGSLSIQSPHPGAFSAHEELLLAQIASQVAPVLENVGLYRQARLRMAELETLFSVTASVSSDLSLGSLLATMSRELAEAIDVSSCAISRWDEDARAVIAIAEYIRPEDDELGDAGVDVGEPYALADYPATEEVLLTRRPLTAYVDDPQSDPRERALLKEYSWGGVLALPMIVHGQVMGLVELYDRRLDRRFTPGEIRLAQTTANQAAIALRHAELFDETVRRLEREEQLNQIAHALADQMELETLIPRMLPLMAQLVKADAGAVQLIDLEQEVIARSYFYNLPQMPSADGTPIRFGAAREAITRRQPVLVEDYQAYPSAQKPWIDCGTHSALTIPLSVHEEVVGVLGLFTLGSSRPLEPGAIPAAEAAAQLASVAIERARLFEAEQRRAEELAALNRITRGLSSGLTLPQLFQNFAADLKTVIPCDRVSIALPDDPAEPDGFIMYAIHDRPDAPLDEGVAMPFSATAASEDLLAGRPHVTDDLATELDFPAERLLHDGGIRSRINIPLIARGRVIGALNLASQRRNAFSPRQLPLLQQVADAVASSLEHVQLYQAVHLHADQLEREVSKRTAELKAERDRTQAILDSAAEGVIVTDLEGRIRYVNPAMERLTGYSVSEVLGQSPDLWQGGTHDDSFFQQMWQTALQGRVWEGELVNRRKDGTLYDAMLTVAPIPGSDGQPVGLVGIQADISQLKELERMKDRFVSNVSHELRTPITNLNLYLNLLEKGPPEKRDKYMATLRREVKRLYQLIEDLLSLSRLDVGSVQVKLIPLDINQPAVQLVRDRMALAGSQGLTLWEDLADDLPLAMADEKLLTQVITNLMTNAMNYTPAGGQVVVKTAAKHLEGGDWVTITVRDTGYGISPEDHEHLFERFFRGQAAQETGAPGTGLGLAICKEIIDRHQGRITAESTLSEGSEFTVWLPALGPGAATV